MNELLEILGDLHPEVDFTTATDLVDGGILDSFDIAGKVRESDWCERPFDCGNRCR